MVPRHNYGRDVAQLIVLLSNRERSKCFQIMYLNAEKKSHYRDLGPKNLSGGVTQVYRNINIYGIDQPPSNLIPSPL